MGHLTDADLTGLLSGRLRARVRRRVVRHLIKGCEDCRARLRAAIGPGRLWSTSTAASEAEYDACFDRAEEGLATFQGRWTEDQGRRERGLNLVHSKGWGRLTPAERRSLRRGTWGYIEMLLSLSFEARYRDPKMMLEFADSALLELDRLDPAVYGWRLLYDLRARIWAEVGNACRVNEYMRRADLAFRHARKFLWCGTGDLLIEARIDEVEASMHKDERELLEAEALLDQACRAYLKLGQRHFAGRTLVTKGISRYLNGNPLEAIPVLRQALLLLDVERDPQLVATAQHNLISALVEAGELREAGELLLESGLRQRFANDPLNLLRLRWLEGLILAGRGRLAEAEQVFGEVRKDFHERGLNLVGIVVGLDEAKVLLRQGKMGPLSTLIQELAERALGRNMSEQVRRSLLLLAGLCRMGLTTLDHIDRARRFLDRLQHDPWLKFEPELLLG